MARARRRFDANLQYFVTSRTFQGRYLMRPDPGVRELIGGLLARGRRHYRIRLYGYVFMSNHFHLIVQGQPRDIPLFVGWLKREISVKLGRKVRGWTGGFWDRRYDAETILDDDALEEKLQYIAAHGVKEGLVAHAMDWPGLHCVEQIDSGEPRRFSVRSGPRGKVQKTEWLVLTPLPKWRKLMPEQRRRAKIRFHRDVELLGRRLLVDRKPLGLEQLLARPFDHRPDPPGRKPKPRCHTTEPALREAFNLQERDYVERFELASHRYRAGDFTTEFPKGAFRPPVPPIDDGD